LASNVDLEACPCVDGGHWWDIAHAVYHVKQKGALRGMAVRTLTCVRCDSTKDQPLTWDGRVAGHSSYDLTDIYIENARALGDHFDRAPNMRKVALERARKSLADQMVESA